MTSDDFHVSEEESHSSISGDQRVGNYRLCFELASGGMATVYLARALGPAGIERIAAIKRIHPHLAKQRSFVEMFLDEARIVSQITHVNVCSVVDFGEANGEYYIAMEYLVGETFSKVIRMLRKTKSPELLESLPMIAAKLIADVCEGLHAAHELRDARGELMGVVHRDVSPQNLFVTYDGVAKIMDFGVALARERLHQTVTGQVKGKHAYMAPEQLGGATIDRRADVFSLGVVFWELLALRHLFKRDTEAKTILNVLNSPIPKPSQVRPGIPRILDDIVLKALARDPDERYPTARDFGRDVMKALARRSAPIGLAEVSDWMRAAFPDGSARKNALVDFARSMDGDIPKIHFSGGDETAPGVTDSGSEVKTVPDSSSELASPTSEGSLRRSRVAVVAAVLIIAVILVFVFVGLRGGDRQQELSHVTAAVSAIWIPEGVKNGSLRDGQDDGDGAETGAKIVPIDAGADSSVEEGDGGGATKSDSPRVKVASRGTGFVSVATPGGWAEVFRGGRRLGQTPLRVKLPAGRHSLRLRPFGKGPPRTVPVRVKRGEVERVVVRLSP